MPHLSVVIPVYKAQECLDELFKRLKESLQLISEDYEIIMIEDCGGDDSWRIIQEHAKNDARIKGIQFSRNFGQHYGITAGIDYCSGDWVVVMDCDLQDSPEDIPRLYRKAQDGYDVVLAKRGKRRDPPLKRLASYLFYKIFSYLADIDYDGDAGNFRIISQKVATNFRNMRERLRFFGGLIQWMGFNTTSIQIHHEKRFTGRSAYTYSKLWQLAADTIIAYSDKPLRISIRFGFAISSASFLYGSYIISRALAYDIPIAGWSSLIVSIFFLGGIIISILGVIGIYLSKVFDETKNRPLYIIKNCTY